MPFDPVRHLRWNKMEAGEETLLGPVNEKFKFKLPDGTVERNTVICNRCSKEFSYHRNSATLKYHLNAKIFLESLQVRAAKAPEAGASRQPHSTEMHWILSEMEMLFIFI